MYSGDILNYNIKKVDYNLVDKMQEIVEFELHDGF